MSATKTQDREQSTTWTFTCRHHRHLRWTKNKCGGGFIGRGVLIFEGDLKTGKRGPISFVQCESSLKQREKDSPEYVREYRERFAAECDCPASDLIVYAKQALTFDAQLEEWNEQKAKRNAARRSRRAYLRSQTA